MHIRLALTAHLFLIATIVTIPGNFIEDGTTPPLGRKESVEMVARQTGAADAKRVEVQCKGVDDSSELDNGRKAARGGFVVITSGQTCVGTNQTLDNLSIARGGFLKPMTGHTITITGNFEAGPYQTFTNALVGQGSISFDGSRTVPVLYPQWWGATGSGVTSDLPAFTAAIAAVPQATQLSGTHQNGAKIYVPATQDFYNLGNGPNGITLNKNGLSFVSDPSALFKYTGPGSAFLINSPFSFFINLEVGEVNSTGAYGIRVTSTSGGSNLSIKWQRISGHSTAGFQVDGGGIAFGAVEAGEIVGGQYNMRFQDGSKGSGKYEGWKIVSRAPFVNATIANVSAGAGFQFSHIEVDTDNTAADAPYKIDLAGSYNTIIWRGMNPANSNSNGLWLRSSAIGNSIIAPALALSLIRDDSKQGSNYISSPLAPIRLTNDSFESWNEGAPVGWIISGNVRVAQETNDVKHGISSIKITGTSGMSNIHQTAPDWVKGRTVTLAGWVKALSTNAYGGSLTLGDDDGNDNTAIPKDNSWHFVKVTHRFAANARNPTLYIFANVMRAGAGEVVYVDGLVMVEGGLAALPSEK